MWFADWKTGVPDLNYCLQFSVADVRKFIGEKYPQKTLKMSYTMIQQHYFNYKLKKWLSLIVDKELFWMQDVFEEQKCGLVQKSGIWNKQKCLR